MKNLLPMQAGDVPATWADTSLLEALTGYKPNTGTYPLVCVAFVELVQSLL